MHNYYAFMTMYTEDWSTYPQCFLHVYIQYTYCILFINLRNIPMKRDWHTFLVLRSHAPAIPCFCVPRSLHFRYAGTRERKFVTGTWIVKNANANFVFLWKIKVDICRPILRYCMCDVVTWYKYSYCMYCIYIYYKIYYIREVNSVLLY